MPTPCTDSGILRGWQCPEAYCRDDLPECSYYSPPLGAERQALAAAINGYREHNRAIAAMVDADDLDALTEWRDSGVWEEVARETGADDEQDVNEYASAVREAFTALIEAID